MELILICGNLWYLLWWSSDKICRVPEFKSRLWSFFHDGILGSQGSNLVFIFLFGILKFLTGYHAWLWKYINEIWERVLANSFSGIHNSKIICSVGGERGVGYRAIHHDLCATQVCTLFSSTVNPWESSGSRVYNNCSRPKRNVGRIQVQWPCDFFLREEVFQT